MEERVEGFAVIPVLDLRRGRVVRARRGERDSYAPIETPLAKGSAPGAVAAGILAAFPAPILYVADLDAIIDGARPTAPPWRPSRGPAPARRSGSMRASTTGPRPRPSRMPGSGAR